MQLPSFKLSINNKQIYIPEILIHNSQLYDEAIETSKEFARNFAGRIGGDEKAFSNFLKQNSPEIASNQSLSQALYDLAQAMKELIEERRDTIWAFILKNLYKPLFLKRQITEEYKLLSGKAELITQMELGTLFFLRASGLYLKEGGVIGFVLPRSVFTSSASLELLHQQD